MARTARTVSSIPSNISIASVFLPIFCRCCAFSLCNRVDDFGSADARSARFSSVFAGSVSISVARVSHVEWCGGIESSLGNESWYCEQWNCYVSFGWWSRMRLFSLTQTHSTVSLFFNLVFSSSFFLSFFLYSHYSVKKIRCADFVSPVEIWAVLQSDLHTYNPNHIVGASCTAS